MLCEILLALNIYGSALCCLFMLNSFNSFSHSIFHSRVITLPAELKEFQVLDIVIIDFSVSVANEFYLFFMLEFIVYKSINCLSKLGFLPEVC